MALKVAIFVGDTATEEFPVVVERLALADEVVMGTDVEESNTELSNECIVNAYEDKPVVGNGSGEVMGLLLDGVPLGVVALPTGVI